METKIILSDEELDSRFVELKKIAHSTGAQLYLIRSLLVEYGFKGTEQEAILLVNWPYGIPFEKALEWGKQNELYGADGAVLIALYKQKAHVAFRKANPSQVLVVSTIQNSLQKDTMPCYDTVEITNSVLNYNGNIPDKLTGKHVWYAFCMTDCAR